MAGNLLKEPRNFLKAIFLQQFGYTTILMYIVYLYFPGRKRGSIDLKVA